MIDDKIIQDDLNKAVNGNTLAMTEAHVYKWERIAKKYFELSETQKLYIENLQKEVDELKAEKVIKSSINGEKQKVVK